MRKAPCLRKYVNTHFMSRVTRIQVDPNLFVAFWQGAVISLLFKFGLLSEGEYVHTLANIAP
jgi:hypothetical protein